MDYQQNTYATQQYRTPEQMQFEYQYRQCMDNIQKADRFGTLAIVFAIAIPFGTALSLFFAIANIIVCKKSAKAALEFGQSVGNEQIIADAEKASRKASIATTILGVILCIAVVVALVLILQNTNFSNLLS